MVGRGLCLRVWGWWVGVGQWWFVLLGLGLVGWGSVGRRSRLVGRWRRWRVWGVGFESSDGACGFGVRELGLAMLAQRCGEGSVGRRS